MDLLTPFAAVAVVVFAAIAGFVDLREFKVPNLLTVPLLLCGIIYHATVGGFGGLQSSLLGAFFGFGVLFGLYVVGAMGAGDVKLMAGVGAWLGVSATLCVFAIAAVATGVYSLLLLTLRGEVRQAITTTWIAMLQFKAMAKHLGPNERVELTVKRPDRRKRLVPFAAMVALGVIAVLGQSRWG